MRATATTNSRVAFALVAAKQLGKARRLARGGRGGGRESIVSAIFVLRPLERSTVISAVSRADVITRAVCRGSACVCVCAGACGLGLRGGGGEGG